MSKLTVDRVELAGKRVFLRVDFNVPLEEGRVAEDTRIRAALPTIELCLKAGAAVLLASHLGRPKGTPDPHYSLRPVAIKLEELLGRPVPLLPDCVGPEVEAAAAALKPGEVVLLENLRFHAEEEANDPGFARRLASLADVYVNDAFAAAHRAHASTEGIARILHPAAAGLLMARSPPWRHDRVEAARAILGRARALGVRVRLPVDLVVAPGPDSVEGIRVASVREMPRDLMGLDIGPVTVAQFAATLASARTIVWNGPLGVFEKAPFSAGTLGTARAVASSAAFSVIGGGDTIAAVHQAGVAERIGYISTAGGAFLEFLEGRTLPGVAALDETA